MQGKMLLPIFLLLFISASWAGNKYFLDYDGNDDYVRYADDSYLEMMNGSSNYTLEGWVYVADDANDGCDLYRRNNQFVIYYRQSSKSLGVGIYSGGWKYYHSTDNTLTTGTWHHFAIIRNNTLTHYFHIYIDGVDVIDGTYNAYVLSSSNSYNLYIGNDGNGGHYFKGYLDEIRLKNVAEDPNNLHYHKNDPEYVSDANTAALFHFNEGTGQYTENEASGANARLGSSTAGDAAEPTWRPWNYNGSDLSLPVELTSFSAIANPFSVLLRWSTASEVENLGFIVQRSMEKEGPFQTLASYQTNPSLKGAGNSSQRHDYSYEDHTVQIGQTYWYRLQDVSISGEKQNHGPIQVNVAAQSKDLQPVGSVTLPKQFKLYPNFPNPFNPETQVTFDIPQTKDCALNLKAVIYDINGKQVRTLYQGAINPGEYRLKWDGINDAGQPMSSGIYILNLKAGQFGNSIKMTLMR